MYPKSGNRQKSLASTGYSVVFHLAIFGGLFLISHAPGLPPVQEAIPVQIVMETPPGKPVPPQLKPVQPKPVEPEPPQKSIAPPPPPPAPMLEIPTPVPPKVTLRPLVKVEKPARLPPRPIAPPKSKQPTKPKALDKPVRPQHKLVPAAPITAPSPPPKAVNREKIIAYVQQVGARIAAMKHYPAAARERGVHGTVVVSFIIDASGQPRNITIARSAGDSALDDAALATVRRAAPFAPPPPGASRELSIALAFKLRG